MARNESVEHWRLAIVNRHRITVPLDVQGKVLAHHAQPNHSDVRKFCHMNLVTKSGGKPPFLTLSWSELSYLSIVERLSAETNLNQLKKSRGWEGRLAPALSA